MIDATMNTFNWLTSSGRLLISDDFSSPGWGTGSDAESSVSYENNTLKFLVSAKNFFVWSNPNAYDYQDVHLEVSVINNGTDPTTAFGIMCDQHGEDTFSFYFFAMTPAGEYAIVKAASAQPDVFLTNNGQWGYSDLIAENAASYRIGADCGRGTLTMYVDGRQIASVSDSSYTIGNVALFTWSGEEAESANVSFDNFLMTEL